MISELSEEADHRTTYNIDCQGTKGKLDALAQLLNIAAQEVTKNRPNEPACADKEEGTQMRLAPERYVDLPLIVLKSSN